MNIKTTENDKTIIISISGLMDPVGIKRFAELSDSICSGVEKDIDIDLSEMDYMDSTCIGILLRLHKFQKQKNLDFKISKASYKVSSLLSLCSLSDALMK